MKKYYASDIALRRMLLGQKHTDVGHILENIIFLELIRRGFKVSIGKMDTFEVDFVAENAEGVFYYQVAATVREQTTLERELRVLQKIRDNHPKHLLTLDDDLDADFDGIKKINALRWLLGN